MNVHNNIACSYSTLKIWLFVVLLPCIILNHTDSPWLIPASHAMIIISFISWNYPCLRLRARYYHFVKSLSFLRTFKTAGKITYKDENTYIIKKWIDINTWQQEPFNPQHMDQEKSITDKTACILAKVHLTQVQDALRLPKLEYKKWS